MSNSEKTVNIRDFKIEAMKRKIIDKANQAYEWVLDHPYQAAAIATAASVVATKGVKAYGIHSENRRRTMDFYDTRLGTHVMARRPLTGREMMEVVRRFTEDKESYAKILYDMKLLK